MSNHEDNRARQPSGQPTGGQYAEEAKGASGLALGAESPAPTDPHGGYRLTKLKTMETRSGIAYTATLTKDGQPVAKVEQEGRGGQTRAYFPGGPGSPEARAFRAASAEIGAEAIEPEEEVFDRLTRVAELNRKRATPFVFDGDDFWQEGQYRALPASYTREQVIAELSKDEHAGSNPKVWDPERGDFTPIGEL